jgi:RNA polymerase sigma-70 factor (ECF subfamily)
LEGSPEISTLNLKDEEVVSSLFQSYYRPLVGFAVKYVETSEVAEGIVQDVFAELWSKGESVMIRTSIKSYLYGAVRNACLNHIKHRKVVWRHEEEVKLQPFQADGDFLELDELQQRIDEAFSKLPTKCREIFELSRYEGLKYHEIAARLAISQKTVENQMGKALKILREHLAPYLPMMVWVIEFLNGGKL